MLRKNSGSRRCLFPPIESHALEIHCSRRFADKTLAGTSSSQDRGTCQCLVKLEMLWAGIWKPWRRCQAASGTFCSHAISPLDGYFALTSHFYFLRACICFFTHVFHCVPGTASTQTRFSFVFLDTICHIPSSTHSAAPRHGAGIWTSKAPHCGPFKTLWSSFTPTLISQ